MGLEDFRGDLEWSLSTADSAFVRPASWTVSHDCPGHAAMQRSLDAAGGRRSEAGPRYLISYAIDGQAPPNCHLLATARCPIVSSAEWHPYLSALWADLLVQPFECSRSPGRP
jgi:hypothetical protein